jgi:hypothetical protein
LSQRDESTGILVVGIDVFFVFFNTADTPSRLPLYCRLVPVHSDRISVLTCPSFPCPSFTSLFSLLFSLFPGLHSFFGVPTLELSLSRLLLSRTILLTRMLALPLLLPVSLLPLLFFCFFLVVFTTLRSLLSRRCCVRLMRSPPLVRCPSSPPLLHPLLPLVSRRYSSCSCWFLPARCVSAFPVSVPKGARRTCHPRWQVCPLRSCPSVGGAGGGSTCGQTRLPIYRTASW